MKVSIIITNYNYSEYVGDAIGSALAVRHDDKEIIVCDDGSTDDSREVIARYAEQIDRVLLQENRGQPAAANYAFAHSSGDVIFFLDSDDMLLPQAAEKVLAVWRAGVAKVQFPMLNVDRNGVFKGTMFPNFTSEISPEEIRATLLQTALYPTPPTTGNAYARDFLLHIFPVPEDRKMEGFDSYMNPTAPLFGDVVTLLEPLAKYRIHGSNSWAQDNFNAKKLAFYVKQDCLRTEYLRQFAARMGVEIAPHPLLRNTPHLMFRLGCLRAAPEEYPFPGEGVSTILRYALKAVAREKTSLVVKALLIGWFLGVAVLPRRLALYLLRLRFVSPTRPPFVTKLLTALGVLRRPVLPVHGSTA